ncbi:hypothetical protein Sjap_007181 [Stephania japonica]|uniref:Uncharacterized protein n=1 Tax=Stephania japonica TaxID=461633 RepID=A0AAP0JM89_9MAGN
MGLAIWRAKQTLHARPHSLERLERPPSGALGRPHYGFDLFSVDLAAYLDDESNDKWTDTDERRLSDGVSVNFNGQFSDDDQSVVFVSERSGSAKIYTKSLQNPKPDQILTISDSLFHDRPTLKNNNRLYFASAHESPDQMFKSCPAVSRSGKFVAVASYGFGSWKGEFHELRTDIVVFPASDPSSRLEICAGGWPSWSGDSTIFFHRVADDGWWSVFRVDLPENFEDFEKSVVATPRRITPPGLHAFTPAAAHDGKLIAVATRRRGRDFRHIEVFNLETNSFHEVTDKVNPNLHHYNPFFSPESRFLGYHRFRGDSCPGDSTIPHLERVNSPMSGLKMLRINGDFPAISSDGNYIAYNPDLEGVNIMRSDGSKRWMVVKGRTAFYTSWNGVEKGVIYTSIGPIFESTKATVQIARISLDLSHLDGRDEVPSEVKVLTRDDTGNNAFPSCSPDGKHVVFRSGRNGHKNLYVMDAVDGELNGEIRQLTDGPWIDTMPSWSRDGEFIAFSSNRHNPDNGEAFSIYLIRPDGTDLRRVHVAGEEGSEDVNRERINHVCFSPDSKWLLFTANVGGVSAEPISLPNQFQPYGDLHIVRLDGSGLQRLTWNGYEMERQHGIGMMTWMWDL